ncbi:MAG: hypothetical protein F2519_05860 [Actinobacteria bacterium]|uniref:Unannotated protein n=1 Tax=freshwater metagenome TaxID=449393 RepID=A0A6J6RPM3_9ZZZZ|nr:hypothetical protein [Actinomycetota bacterium]MSY82611.1 hypothetical protein [Actinomycetota bacterium]MTA05082.1 hypothetical protein [Actinomycetota bacterium]MTA23214.1 hypothetical protein [Actinomycetota bacterium]
MRLKLIGTFALLFALFTPNFASAVDIPLLTWERGRVQEVVLGGSAATGNWVVTLESEGEPTLTFSASRRNASGYLVYTVSIPDDYARGGYVVYAYGDGTPKTKVAAVSVVPRITFEVTKVPKELAWINVLIVFLTATISAFRARKYSFLTFESTQLSPTGLDAYDITNAKSKIAMNFKPYALRIRAISDLRPSLVRYLLLRNGELAHRLSPTLYGILPVIGVLGAFVASVEVDKAKSLAATGVAAFLAIALLGVFDAFSGLIASIAFWTIQFFVGNVSSFRDFIVMFALGVCWVAPGLFTSIYREAAARDLIKPVSYFSGLIEASLVGGLIFYLGQLAINSFLVNISSARSINYLTIVIVAIAIIIRAIVEDLSGKQLTSGTSRFEHETESITIARVSSPETAVALTLIFFSFSYLWTASFGKSVIFALIFAAPYYLLFIAIPEAGLRFMAKLPRNIFLEALIAVGLTWTVYQQISTLPLLSTQKSQVFLICAGIPGLLHALYSAMCDSAERKGIITS